MIKVAYFDCVDHESAVSIAAHPIAQEVKLTIVAPLPSGVFRVYVPIDRRNTLPIHHQTGELEL